jgi:hypothetical protein
LTLSGQVTRLSLDETWPDLAEGQEIDPDLGTVLRGTTVLVHADPLQPAAESIDEEDVADDLLELDGLYRDL